MSKAHVYRFGPGMTDGDAEMKNLLGMSYWLKQVFHTKN